MERRRGIFYKDLSKRQLLDLFGLESFSGERENILCEFRRRGSTLPPNIFRLAYPDCHEEFTGRCLMGSTVDGPVGISLRQLVHVSPEGEEVRSEDYF